MLALAALALALTPVPPAGRDVAPDGRFLPGEWDDAAVHRLAGGAELLLKHSGGRLLVGLRQRPGELRYADLYVRDAAGRLLNLHASMQQGERLLGPGWTDRSPAFRWGPLPGWQTSIVRHNGAPAERPLGEQLHPYQGYELSIPFAQLGPPPWRLRIEFRDFRGEAPDIVWPAGSVRTDESKWGVVAPGAPLTSH